MPPRFPTVSPRVASILLSLAIAALVVQICDAVVAERALYADAANFYLSGQLSPSAWSVASDPKHPRLFVNALNQGPVILARMVGITDFHALRLWFGAGLFAVPLVLFGWCVRLGTRARDYRVALAMGAGATAAIMPSQIFILEQAITTTALAWILLSYQVLPLHWRWYDYVVASAASVLLLQSHETALVLGVILALLAIEATRVAGWDRARRHTLAIGGVGLLIAVYMVWWMSTHPVLAGTANFLGLWYLAQPWELWIANGRPSLYLLLAAPCAVFATMSTFAIHQQRRLDMFARGIALFGGVAVVMGALSPWLQPQIVAPRVQFDLRFLIPFVSAGFMALGGAWVLSGPDARSGAHTTLKVTIAVALLSAVSWQFANTHQWRQFDGAVREVLAQSPPGEVDPIRVRERLQQAGTPNAWRMQWEWAWGFLSLTRLDQPHVAVMIVPTGERQAFRSPRTAQDSLRLPWWMVIPPGAPYRFEALAAACAAGRCDLEPVPPTSVR